MVGVRSLENRCYPSSADRVFGPRLVEDKPQTQTRGLRYANYGWAWTHGPSPCVQDGWRAFARNHPTCHSEEPSDEESAFAGNKKQIPRCRSE
jgi:hypothetical protein